MGQNYSFVAFHAGQYHAELLAHQQIEEGFGGILSPTAFGIGVMMAEHNIPKRISIFHDTEFMDGWDFGQSDLIQSMMDLMFR